MLSRFSAPQRRALFIFASLWLGALVVAVALAVTPG